jgi:acetate kinase
MRPMDSILVVNAGSSSVKFQLFALDGAAQLTRKIKGQIEGIGTRPRFRASGPDRTTLIDREYDAPTIADVPAAMRSAGAWLREEPRIAPSAVGHRVVHGGPEYDNPVLINEQVLARLERYVPLAPLHQPHNLAPIRAILADFPELPQVACFDTAFHRNHSAAADHYAIPQPLYAEGVRRYGFHGLSYEYIASRLPEVAPEVAAGRVIVAQIRTRVARLLLWATTSERPEHNKGRTFRHDLGSVALTICGGGRHDDVALRSHSLPARTMLGLSSIPSSATPCSKSAWNTARSLRREKGSWQPTRPSPR